MSIALWICLGMLEIVPPALQEEVLNRLVRDLGSDSLETRDRAARELVALGKPALEAMKKLAENAPEKEVRSRAAQIAKEIDIALRTSKPVVKDGLSITVLPLKATVDAGESPVLEWTLKNVSEKDVVVNVPSLWTADWQTFSLKDSKGRSWSFGMHIPGDPNESPRTLKPGESLSNQAALTAFFPDDPKQAGNEQRRLAAGKYTAVLTLRFYSTPGQEGWTGPILSNPVEFEVK